MGRLASKTQKKKHIFLDIYLYSHYTVEKCSHISVMGKDTGTNEKTNHA